MNDKFLVSVPYLYPICPLSIDHARMFLVADIMARHCRLREAKVYFPVASHYSGNTAHHIAELISRAYSTGSASDSDAKKAFHLFRDVYNTPGYILKEFTDPMNILDYYSQEILWELRSLDVSCDYGYYYTTKSEDFSAFVNSIMQCYHNKNLLLGDDVESMALDYDDVIWKKKALDQLNRTEFIQPFHKNSVIAAMANVKSKWRLLRTSGYGAVYLDKWTVDPMFDSELFTIFDLYARFSQSNPIERPHLKSFFDGLLAQLRLGSRPEDILIAQIADCLPCDVLVCEEHLKNWVVKKAYAESLLLAERFRTRSYFITGMGMLDGTRMSASAGHAVLASDLVKSYGPTKARLIILLTGGHPSKSYDYDSDTPILADKLLRGSTDYLAYLVALRDREGDHSESDRGQCLSTIASSIEKSVGAGYYRQAILELLSIIPKTFRALTSKDARDLLLLYRKYLGILLPGLLEGFQRE